MLTYILDKASGDVYPLMIVLAQPVPGNGSKEATLGALTKYKTFNGEEIGGQKVWHYDYHDDEM